MTHSIAFRESLARNRRKFRGTLAEARRMNSDELRERLRWYEDDDYERIARFLGFTVLVARFRKLTSLIESAAYSLWWARPCFGRPSYAEVEKQLCKIGDAAERLHSLVKSKSHLLLLSDPQISDATDKLLLYLSIDDLLDGTSPLDDAVCHLLVDVEPPIGTSELELIAKKIHRFEEVAAVTAELRHRAVEAAKDAEWMHEHTHLEGHRGDMRLNAWVGQMMTGAKILFGAKGILSDRSKNGQAKYLCALLEGAAMPLGVSQTKTQWYRRVRTVGNIS